MGHFCYECKFFSYNVMGEGVCTATDTKVGQYNKVCEEYKVVYLDNFELKDKQL